MDIVNPKQTADFEQPKVETTEPDVEVSSDFEIPSELQEAIETHAKELKTKFKLRKVFAVVVAGEGENDKPYYIGYFRRPGLMPFSQYMSFVQKDVVQANKNLSQNIFLDGDRELIDDEELFIYGLMQQIGNIVGSLDSKLVKA